MQNQKFQRQPKPIILPTGSTWSNLSHAFIVVTYPIVDLAAFQRGPFHFVSAARKDLVITKWVVAGLALHTAAFVIAPKLDTAT